jgi:hypothetical protein
LSPFGGFLRLPHGRAKALDLAAHRLPAPAGPRTGADWYDALELSGGDTLLGVGELTGPAPVPDVTRAVAMLLGAVRGMAMAGTAPGRLLDWLGQLLGADGPQAPGSAVCCRYRPDTRTLTWAQTGHPAPLLFRDGTGRVLRAPDGVRPGADPDAAHGQADETLAPGDLLVLHTGGLVPGHRSAAAVPRLLGLAPRFAALRSARECARAVAEEFGGTGRGDGACVLVARVTP